MIGGLAFTIKSITTGSNKLINEMATNHKDITQSLVNEVRVTTELDTRIKGLEKGHEELKHENSEIMLKLDNVGERVDDIYSFLLKNQKQ